MPYGRYKTDYGGVVDFVRLTRERRERARKSMGKYGLDAVLCFGEANCRYLTVGRSGTGGYTGYKYVLFPIAGEPIYHDAGMNAKALQYAVTDLDVRYSIPMPPELETHNLPAYKFQVGNFVNQIKGELKEAKILSGKIGIDGLAYVTPIITDALKAAGINISADGRAAMAEARLLKTRDEIELLRGACAIVEACFQTAKEMIKPGVTEKQVWAAICKTVFDCGGEAVEGGHICSGPNSFPIANTITDRIIRPQDIILIDVYNISYHGYRTCYYRNFSCGKPTQVQKDAWKKAVESTYEVINIIKPGCSTREIVEKFLKAKEFGYDSEADAMMGQWVHGIGLTQIEAPNVSRTWDLDYPVELQEGMIMAVETQVPTWEKTGAYPQGQCLRIEEEVLVTKTGCEVLSQWPIDEITVCW